MHRKSTSRVLYLKTGRDLRRMESNSRSPIFSGFGELLEGIVANSMPAPR
ncbi:hypothetical protein EDB19DRAFT_1870900 [Suillus lakei]|nr:hypothetical protein EDB19DRAFT_1870900 [Suillus lakei]